MKVAFLNCTDELNPEAGSELTCVFLDKIPGTLEFCKRLKLKDPNLYFDAYVHNGQHVNASRLPELQTAYMSSMPTVSSIEKIPQSAMSNIC